MSYGCEISFKHIKAEELFDFFVKFKQTVTKHLDEIAEENYCFCPFIKNALNVERDMSKISDRDMLASKYWAMNSIFKYRYFYDKENELLGVYSVHFVPELQSLFDGRVYFQNSTDQDYERDEYGGIDIFEKIYDEYMLMPLDRLIEKYNSRYEWSNWSRDFEDEELTEDRIAYQRRSLAYDEIWSKYEHTLEDETCIVYLSLYGAYELMEILSFLSKCHAAQIRWEDSIRPQLLNKYMEETDEN